MDTLKLDAFCALYCERQESTPEQLTATLKQQVARFQPEGFMMLEAGLMDSSFFGQRVILPYGPNNTYKTVPDHPISPRGLASDTSTVIAVLPAAEV